MIKYWYSTTNHGDESGFETYRASEVDARIAELETRLIACETAMLLGCNINHPGIQSYFGKYPDPYIPG